jgi:hypothetical protein
LTGKSAAVTSGDWVQYVDPISGALRPMLSGSEHVIDVDGGRDSFLLDRDGKIVLDSDGGQVPHLPRGFEATAFSRSTARTAVVGTVDGSPAIVLLGDERVQATVVLENATDGAALAWTGPHTVSAVSGDALYDIEVP